MKLEHIALNVEDPAAMAEWYSGNLGLEVALRKDDPAMTHFLRDSGGRMLVEIYRNPPDQVPAYGEMDSLMLHLAFVCDDPARDKDRLMAAGATLVSDDRLDDGSHLVMLRDPWGLAVQLCRRAQSMFA